MVEDSESLSSTAFPQELVTQVLLWRTIGASQDRGRRRRSSSINHALDRADIAKPELRELAGISKSFHSAVLSPQLWTEIRVPWYWPVAPQDGTEPLLALILLALKRSGMAQLDVTIELDESHMTEWRPDHDEALQLVVLESQRWKSLHLTVRGDITWNNVRPITGSLGSLQSLVLDVQLDDEQELPFEISNLFETTPRLSMFSSRNHANRFTIPWTQIHSFEFLQDYTSPLAISGALQKIVYPKAEVHLACTDFSDRCAVEPISLDIRSLSIQVHLPDDAINEALGNTIDSIRVSGLEHLVVCGSSLRAMAVWPSDAFNRFSFHSSLQNTLRTLELAYVRMGSDELIACLTLVPALENLLLTDYEGHPVSPLENLLLTDYTGHPTGCSWDIEAERPCIMLTDKLLSRLCRTPYHSDIVPCLKLLKSSGIPDFEDSTLLKFLESRISRTDPIRPFHLSLTPRGYTIGRSALDRIAEWITAKDLEFYHHIGEY